MTIRVGVVGCGMGRLHALGYRLEKLCATLQWVADLDQARARQVAAEVGCRALTDWASGLADVDAVSICTPHHLHASQSIQAMRAGKHVLVEKPMAITEPDCLEMIQTAAACDVRLMVGYTMRYRPAPQWLSRAIAEQRYGPLLQVSAWTQTYHHAQPGSPSSQWHTRRDQLGGGVLFSHGCHYIDLIQWYMGMPEQVGLVATRGGRHWMEGERTAMAIMEFPGGGIASYNCSWDMQHSMLNGMHVHCTEAVLSTDYTSVKVVTGRERGTTSPEVVVPAPQPAQQPPGWNTLGEINHFLDCIERHEEPLTGGREAMKSLQIIWRMYRESGWDRR